VGLLKLRLHPAAGGKIAATRQIIFGSIAAKAVKDLCAINFSRQRQAKRLEFTITMRADKNNPFARGETRRQFIKKTGMAAAAVAGASLLPLQISAAENKSAVTIALDPDDATVHEPPVQWATEQLRNALTARGIAVQYRESINQAPPSQLCVTVARGAMDSANAAMLDVPESFWLERKKIGKWPVLMVNGSDARGLVYALLELTDRVNFSADPIAVLKTVKPISERPVNSIRSISRGFNSVVPGPRFLAALPHNAGGKPVQPFQPHAGTRL
jgi:hypothetical protein